MDMVDETDMNEMVKRCFIIAYAKVFVDEIERLATWLCPEECNYIDEATLEWVYHEDGESNFRSWAAYDLFEFSAYLSASRGLILREFFDETLKCGLPDDAVNTVFWKYGDPYLYVMCNWNDELIMCLHEILV